MKGRNLVPAMLLLTLSAPLPAQTAEVGRQRVAGPQAGLQADKQAPRRSRTQAKDELSAALVEQACQYLRCRAGGAAPAPAPELRDAWDRFYLACDPAIRNFARSFQTRGDDLDDCVQEVWADLLESLPDFKPDRSRGKFTSWLYTIVRSKATNLIRRQARDRCEDLPPSLATTSDSPCRILERKCQMEAVREALAVLKSQTSERSFRVLHLRQLEGYAVREVGEELGMKPGQVWVTEHRMKRKLRNLLEDAKLADNV